MTRDLQVVLKVAERCNINCSYCYYLNSGNDAPYRRPPFISDAVAHGVVRFVHDCAEQIALGRVRIVLHGGEPLMLKKARFRSVCTILDQLRAVRPDLSIVMTTNAMLIDDEWLALLEEFGVGICVSLDGPQEYHDRERVDFNGQGTYARVVAGVEQLQRAAALGRIAAPSVLSVIDPRSRGAVVYHHLIRSLGFRMADFLVPMTIHDANPKPEEIQAVGRFLVDAFHEWVKDDDPTINVRIFARYLARLLGRATDENMNPTHIVMGVGSDGTIVNDDLMQVLGPQIFDRNLNVRDSSISDYLCELTKGEVAGVYQSYHECTQCPWFYACRPATVPWQGAEMRYKRGTGFQNRLVHCEAFQELFAAMKTFIDGSTSNSVAA